MSRDPPLLHIGYFQALVGKKLAATPCIYGWGEEDEDFIYVFERLPATYEVLDDVLHAPDGAQLLTVQIMRQIAQHAEALFYEIGRRQHVYTDFSMKNIMRDQNTGDIVFIDLDSAWSHERLKSGKGEPTGDFANHYWCLWKEYIVKGHSGTFPSYDKLPMSLVLSLAAVWGKSLGMERNSPQSVNQALNFVRDPSYDGQRPLWNALRDKKPGPFRDYFRIPASAVDDLFYEWHGLFKDLISTKDVSWLDIRKAVAELAAIYPGQVRNRVIPPVSPPPPRKGPPPNFVGVDPLLGISAKASNSTAQKPVTAVVPLPATSPVSPPIPPSGGNIVDPPNSPGATSPPHDSFWALRLKKIGLVCLLYFAILCIGVLANGAAGALPWEAESRNAVTTCAVLVAGWLSGAWYAQTGNSPHIF